MDFSLTPKVLRVSGFEQFERRAHWSKEEISHIVEIKNRQPIIFDTIIKKMYDVNIKIDKELKEEYKASMVKLFVDGLAKCGLQYEFKFRLAMGMGCLLEYKPEVK